LLIHTDNTFGIGNITLFCIYRILCPKTWQEVFGWGKYEGGEERWEKIRITPPSSDI